MKEKGVSPQEYSRKPSFNTVRTAYTSGVSGLAAGIGATVALAGGDGRNIGIVAAVMGGTGMVLSAREGIRKIRSNSQDIYETGYQDGKDNKEILTNESYPSFQTSEIPNDIAVPVVEETHSYQVPRVASSLAVMIMEDKLKEGKPLFFPSINVNLTSKNLKGSNNIDQP